MRIPVHRQREIARLHFHDPGRSARSIAEAIGASPNTINSLRKRLLASGQTWDALQELDDVGWCAALDTHNRSIAQSKPQPDWEWVHGEMARPDATQQQIWLEWRERCPDGIGLTQFSTHYKAWVKTRKLSMRQVHAPGNKLFVDFAGRTVEIRDPQGGPSTFAQIFVAALGYSSYVYLQAVASQSTEDWVHCHVNCFRALGGVPKWVVCDNLKAAVIRRGGEEIVLNATYAECMKHYHTVALPARAYHPKDKPKAEVSVQIAQRWVLFRLRDRIFFDLADVNEELRRLTKYLNERPMQRGGGSRADRLEVERPALGTLEEKEFQLADWRYNVRVAIDHHVEHGRCFYSVPYALAGLQVSLRITAQTIEVLHNSRRVALHPLCTLPGEVRTLPEHRPVAHVRVLEGEPKAISEWASRVGTQTAAMIRYHLEERSDTTNGVRTAQKLRDLARLHGEARFEEVCAYALSVNITSMRSIESIIRENADKRQRPREPQQQPERHEHVRGAEYYGEA